MPHPAIRLTLEAAQVALQDLGIDYRGSNMGVFFGNLLTTVDELDDERFEINNYNGVGRCVSIRANRISFTFDLHGPSLTVYAACLASATLMHLAPCSINLGEVDQALVVGANMIINPEHTVSFSKLGVLLPTGSSKSFDASADGYACAEGVAVVLIKRLDRAHADRDLIYSFIKGSAINANSKGKSLTMPKGDMQTETIKEAYRVAKRDPSEVFYVELHATRTKVGDPIETNAAGKVFSKGRDTEKPLRVGSVKANLGHTEGCSFLASLVKVSLMLHHKEVIPNIQFTKANTKIDFPALRMQVQTELESIVMAASDRSWVTSISSYGVGGSNAHLLLESVETVADVSKVVTAQSDQRKPLYLLSMGSLTEPTLGCWKDFLVNAYDEITDNCTPLSQGTKTPFVSVMSTTDGKWLDRDPDVNYCWDNIHHPVLSGTAINKIISDEGPDGVRFMEIAPHPVLKAYIEQCGGEPITLICHPNPKVPAQNTGKHYQLLEGIRNLLSSGFKNVDFDKLCASPDSTSEFVKAKLPDYQYNKSHCWMESGLW
ncbi:thiolase-like protein [Boletus reticuloceps]|uniref:Thiolase-like protein n=1 Tax=Boletus reticuloceps TaxID=495285 RepID=A0A8I2Z043_9AGAM|nr:thiolase-like protein [Boletus reticuloceps]